MKSRFTGCLLGGALGDALGYPIEFLSLDEIRKRFGTATPRDLTLGLAPLAVVSDDTQMTLFTAEGVIRGIQRWNDRGIASLSGAVHQALLRWLGTQIGDTDDRTGWLVREPRLHARRAPGNTCLSALQHARRGGHMPSVEAPVNDSKGCGAIMRSAPIGLAAADRQHAFELARDAGALTHGHPSGYLSAAYFGALIHDVSRSRPLDEALAAADALLTREPRHEEVAQAVADARTLAAAGPPTPEALESLGGGWVGEEALAIAVACVLTADSSAPSSVADALWRAVCHSGDSDSTGSLTGNLLGAMLGAEALPAEWLSHLELQDVVERLALDLFSASPHSAIGSR
jgi:ADP-ribosylglycohydrolase